MKLRYDFQFKRIGSTYVGAIAQQNAHLFSGVIQLNEVGYFIVSCLRDDTGREQIVDALLAEYDVDRQTAMECVDDVIDYLRQEGVLSD